MRAETQFEHSPVSIMNNNGTSSTGLFVLGMHRSGTSALTRVLNLLGMHLGDQLLGAREGNVAGHWEPIPVIELNERLLAALGRTWDDPRAMESGWLTNSSVQALLPEASMLLQRDYLPQAYWSIKDPRISRLLPFWLQATRHQVDLRVSAVIAVRHPWEVASSLNRRDGIALSKGMLLWLQHTSEALDASLGMRRAVVSFEALLANWTMEIERLSSALDLPLVEARQGGVEDSIGNFLSPGSRHEIHDNDDALVPEVLLSLYDRLKDARDEDAVVAAHEFAMQISRASEACSDALTDIWVHKMRLHRRVVELEVAASEASSVAYERRDADLKREMEGITQHLSRADWVNQELENKWREAVSELNALRESSAVQAGHLSRAEQVNEELEKQWREAENELYVMKGNSALQAEHLSRADQVNQELERKWHEAENSLHVLKGAGTEQAQQIRSLGQENEQLKREKDYLQSEVKALYAESRLLTLRNEQVSAEMRELKMGWYSRIGRLLRREVR